MRGAQTGAGVAAGSGPALAGVQFCFTLAWTAYALQLPGLLAAAGIAAGWLPQLLMADQFIFAAMDIAFGFVADRVAAGYRRLARLLLGLSVVSAFAFLLLPAVAGPGALLAVLLLWVVSTSAVRAPTLVLLAKRARAAQQPGLVLWYSAGIALASALAPFVGLALKGADPRLPFAVSGLALLGAVLVLLRVIGPAPTAADDPADEAAPRPLAFTAYLPLLAVLGVGAFGFQVHSVVNSPPLHLALAAGERLPWLLPALWLGFFAVLPGVGGLVRRFGALPVATAGLLLTALACAASPAVDGLGLLVVVQLVAGAGWGLAFAGLMEAATAAGTRGAEGLFLGSFFAVTALAALARIGFASRLLPAVRDLQFVLPAAALFAAGLLAAVYVLRRPKSRSAPGRG